MGKINLQDDSVRSSFFKYLIPALSGMLIKSAFIMGDTLFIGRGVGPDGIAAVALTMPYFSFFMAISMMIGIGGAAMMSIEYGRGQPEKGQHLFTQSLVLVTVVSAALVSLGLYYLEEMIALTGATGTIAELAIEYLDTMLKFFVVYAIAWVASCFVRNDANPKLAMYSMIGGAVVNLVLDYLFVMVFGWGMFGAAVATGISQVLILLMLVPHFTHKMGRLRLTLEGMGVNWWGEITKIGAPIFFIELTAAFTIMMFNYILLHNYSNDYVVAYGLTANVFVFALFTMAGIGQASQPIISYFHGANQQQRINEALTLGFNYAVGSGLLFTLFIWLGGAGVIVGYYIVGSAELMQIAINSLDIYFLAAPLMGINMIIANLFQSTANPVWATVISLCRGFLFVALGLIVMPMVFPENGIWASIAFAEGLTLVISAALYWRYRHLNQHPVAPAI